MALQALIFVKNSYLAFMDLGKHLELEDLNFLSPLRTAVKLSLSLAQLIHVFSYISRPTVKKNKKKKIVLRCMTIGACAVQFLHFIPL